MRLILENRELINLRKVLVCMVMKRFRSSAYFFSEEQYREWAFEVVDEGIGVALSSEDWNSARTKDTSPQCLRGLKVWYIYMKVRTIARCDIQREARYYQAKQLCLLAPEPLDQSIELALARIDILSALAQLSSDQRAAFSLVYFAGLSIEQAAVILKRTQRAMDMLLSRAKKAIGRSFIEALSNPPPAKPKPEKNTEKLA